MDDCDNKASPERVVAHGCAEPPQNRGGRHVGSVELKLGLRKAHAHQATPTFDHQRRARPSDAIGKIGEERRHRCEDASVRKVGLSVGRKRTTVDDDGHRRPEWE